MSRQGNWGTVKVADAKACALYYEVSNVGKTIESSKKRVVWRLKVEEGREFEITLTHSLASGKKVLRVDGIVKYTSQSLSFGDWDYVFNLQGGHCVHIIIKPSVELNDMYDLIIDNVSFRRLPDRLDPAARSKNGGVTSTSSSGSNSHKPTSNSTYSYSNGSYGGSGSRDASFGPWECPRCTLVNEKPLAPICEACGGPKPEHISADARMRAKTVAESRSPAPAASTTRPTSKSTAAAPSSPSSGGFFTSSFAATTTADVTKGFDAFADTPAASRKKSDHDISSMLADLDFTPVAPPVAAPVPFELGFSTSDGASAPPADGDASSRTASGDLWDSNIVDLNLRPEDKKPPSRSAKSYQTLEQARMQAPKEKVAVLPPPPPQMPVQMAAVPMVAPMGYYATPAQMMQGGYYHGAQPMYATTSAPGYGVGGQPQQYAAAGYGGVVQAPGTYQFMTAAPNAAGMPVHKPQTMMLSADPFATLS